MIERLQRALEHIEELSPEAQREVAQQIEALTTPIETPQALRSLPADDSTPESVRIALALGGVWSDLQDDEFEALSRIRHASAPTPSVEDQLAWLDDEVSD